MTKTTMDLFKRSVPVLSIFQDENRQKIILLLCDNDELSVNQITNQLDLSRPAISHHLKLMIDAGIVNVNKIGKERYYRNNLSDTVRLLKDLAKSLEESISSK